MTKRRFFLICCFIFICINIFLIIRDDDKVKRIVYIPQWTEVIEKDMYDILYTEGVIDYSDEEFVYFDERKGVFDRFLVAEGDEVFAGDELFAYKVENYEQMRTQLEADIAHLKSSIKAVEEAIRKTERQSVSRSYSNVNIPIIDGSVSIGNSRVGIALEADDSLIISDDREDVRIQKEQYMIERKKELDQLKGRLEAVEVMRDDLVSTGESIYVKSPVNGKVTDISNTLMNPLITIESTTLHVVGQLTEAGRMKVEEGMQVKMGLNHGDQLEDDILNDKKLSEVDNVFQNSSDKDSHSLSGVVDFVHDDPEHLSINNDSTYLFHVSFDDNVDVETLLRGYHVSLDITLRESFNTSVIDKEYVFLDSFHLLSDYDEIDSEDRFHNEQLSDNIIDDKFNEDVKYNSQLDDHLDELNTGIDTNIEPVVWNMEHDSTIIKRKVNTGIEMGDYIELDNFYIGDRVALNSRKNLIDGATFITPFKPSKSDWKTIFQDGARKRSLLIGLLAR